MISFTAKITKKRIFVAALIILIPICILASYVTAAEQNQGYSFSRVGGTTNERIAFLAQFGWEVEGSSETVKDTIIPAQFDDVYEPYNLIQTNQGFDLTPYKGKTVKLYSLKVINYPENSEYVYATLLVYDNTVIGGDIHSTSMDGFMHGFNLTGTGLSMGQLKTN
ncbi:MAG: DUF4830 domain-containing protein [Clostridia bacterium]|nr:DUF4830 domain-containing protein [Clostridia bacterium]